MGYAQSETRASGCTAKLRPCQMAKQRSVAAEKRARGTVVGAAGYQDGLLVALHPPGWAVSAAQQSASYAAPPHFFHGGGDPRKTPLVNKQAARADG